MSNSPQVNSETNNLNRRIWYQLIDSSTGEPYKATSADYVLSPSSDVVDQLKKAVKKNNPNKLSYVDASDLIVYASESAFKKRNSVEGKEQPLKSSSSLSSLGESENEALIVVVPSNDWISDTNGNKSVDVSFEIYNELTVPFDHEPTLDELPSFVIRDPLTQFPISPCNFHRL